MNSTQFIGSGFYIDSSTEIIFIPLAIQLIATLIGALVGFDLVMLWDRKKKRDETNKIKNQTIDLIIDELDSLLIGFNTEKTANHITWNKDENQFKGRYDLAVIPVFESIVNTGNLVQLPPNLRTKLNVLYYNIKHYNDFIDQMLKFYSTPIFSNNNTSIVEREANKLIFHVNDLMPKWIETIKEILPELEAEKTPK